MDYNLTFIYAQDLKGGIGYRNELPWYIPNDLKFFKKNTMGHTIVMGRKTFESMNRRLLPGRQSIVVSRQEDYGKDIDGLIKLNQPEELVTYAKKHPDRKIMIIGGSQLFNELFPYANHIIRTVIQEEFPADVFMPEINPEDWTLVNRIQGATDEKNKYEHYHEWWNRIDS